MEIVAHEAGDLKSEVKFEKGMIIANSKLASKGVKANVEVVIESDYFLDELAKKIPGQIDDAVINMLKLALKAV